MSDFKPFEVIMRIDFAASDKKQICAHAEKVQELVRCRDCRWHEQEQRGMVYCPRIVGNWVEECWFCADGEEREDENADMRGKEANKR